MANEQKGGGPSAADMANAGGSSGAGGYGSSQDAVNREDAQQGQGQASDAPSRGESFDEAQGGGRGADQVSPSSEEMELTQDQGGGRGADQVSPSSEEMELTQDQRDHQQRGQEEAEFEAEAD